MVMLDRSASEAPRLTLDRVTMAPVSPPERQTGCACLCMGNWCNSRKLGISFRLRRAPCRHRPHQNQMGLISNAMPIFWGLVPLATAAKISK